MLHFSRERLLVKNRKLFDNEVLRTEQNFKEMIIKCVCMCVCVCLYLFHAHINASTYEGRWLY